MTSTTKIKTELKKKWSESKTIKFVKLYEAEEDLWNIKLKNYKNKEARNAAIERIIHALDVPGLTIQDVAMKINNIRSTYLQEKAKITKSVVTGSDIYVPSLVWFDIADRFLSGVTKSKHTFNQNVVDTNECCYVDIKISPPRDMLATSPSPASSLSSTEDKTQYIYTDRKRFKKSLPHIKKSIETLQESFNEFTREEDEFDYFGKNVASQLRQLPLMDALDVQSDILHLMKIKRQSLM